MVFLLKIQYLGSAACEGWPAVFCDCDACRKAWELGGKNIRTRAQALIDDALLIDLPPDTYYHALQSGVRLSGIRTLLITHSHQDHFYPAELVMRADPYAHIRGTNPLDVYGNDKVHVFYDSALWQYDDSRNLMQRVRFHEVSAFHSFDTCEGYHVTPLAANHDKNEKCLIYLIEKDGRSLLYANDSGLFPEATWEYLRGKHLDIVSLDCTCVTEKEGSNHMGLPDNAIAKEKLLSLNCMDDRTKIVVTHFSHNGRLMHDEIVAKASKYDFIAAYDGFELISD